LVALVTVACVAIGLKYWSGGADGYRARSDTAVAQTASASPAAPNVLRRKFIGSGKDTPFEGYVDQYSRKIERVANSSYPQAIRGEYGTVQLTADVRSDGSLDRVEINKSSRNPVLDAAAENFVRAAQPFDAFSAHSLTEVDVLYITRTFTFAKGAVREGQ